MTLDRRIAIEADRSLTPDQRLLLSISVTYETFFAEAGRVMNSHLAGTLVALATLLAVYGFVFYALSGAVATR